MANKTIARCWINKWIKKKKDVMNYPLDVDKWKKLVKNHATKIIYDNEIDFDNTIPRHEGPFLVFNIDESHDDFYGQGPTNLAFAWWDKSNKKFMSFINKDREISLHDFYDFCNHNVGGHSGKISHYIEDYELSRLLIELLK